MGNKSQQIPLKVFYTGVKLRQTRNLWH